MRSAVVVVACLFAGVGAWGAMVSVTNGSTIYASELFGEGHSSPAYPDGMTPMVVLTIPADLADRAAVVDTTTPANNRDACSALGHNGEADITFMLSGGAQFNSNVAGLMWDPDGADATISGRTAPGTVATIKEGGRKGDSSITITVKPAGSDATDTGVDTADTVRFGGLRAAADSWVDQEKCEVASGRIHQTISFELPQLANLGALGGANALDMNPKNDQPKITVSGSSRLVSGAFSNGSLTGLTPPTVISSRDAVTLEISDKNEKTIAIDGDAAFMSIKGANKDGYVELATVTIETKHIRTAAKAAEARKLVGYLQGAATETEDTPDDDVEVYLPGKAPAEAVPYTIYDLDGDTIDEGLRGVLMVHAMGTRDLFNEDDMLFVDYDKNGKMGAGEEITIDGNMAMSNALSVDPDKSESFTEAGTGSFKVYYMAGGKGHINHEAMINVTAMVHYSDPSANNEADAKTSTTLKFDGVGGAVMAYAIPHSTNSIGDKGNVRVRCEASAGCRVFLECWDDMGMRGFGEAPMVGGNSVMVWSGEDIEGVTGMEPTSRHSCRILSKGMVTVQQLTRDGNSGTLVNNTYVGGS
ncbi:MAG: hypothetical protein F4Y01_11685 [Gammaproteobacteria bacterium]|nr:hypothetical protein [Gammaproteobacteria bacterium]